MMLVTPWISAQIPATTRSMYALWMKNWPEVQKASPVSRIPDMSSVHHSGLTARSMNARTIHHTPAIRRESQAVLAQRRDLLRGCENVVPGDTLQHVRLRELLPSRGAVFLRARACYCRGGGYVARAGRTVVARAVTEPSCDPWRRLE